MIAKLCDIELDKPNFEDHIGLAADLALKFLERRRGSALSPVEDSEEYSIACEALLKALSGYKSDKAKFSTYAYHCIRNALISYVRHRKYAPNFLDPKDIEEIAENRNCTVDPALLDLFLSESENDRESERIDKAMLREHYLQQLTLQQIATNRKITKMRVKQRIDRAINRIKKKYRSYIGESE